MAFEYLSNVPLEEAVEGFLAALEERGMTPAVESVPVGEALGRVTAEPLYAAISAPHYHACAMDGIALAARVTFGASATTPVVVQPGDYEVVDTGDPLPEGCDAVVMIEDVVFAEGDGMDDLGTCPVTLYASIAPWGNVRQIGEDICAGEMLLTSNVRVQPAAMGAMLAAGVQAVSVIARPRVGIIPTGDEVVAPSANPQPGDVMEFNSTIFSGMVRQWGGEPVVYPIVKDKPELVRDALQRAVDECDVVLLNAGSSAGRDDYSSRAVAEVGELLYHGIAIKPGKPAILGCAGRKAIIGVPGYPVSGIIVAESLLKPIIERLCGCAVELAETVEATLARPCTSSLKYEEFVRVRLGVVGDRSVATPLSRGAGVVTSFVKADGIMTVPQNSEGYETGEKVRVRLLRPFAEIERSLVVIGSHDPLIDEVAQLMHATWPELSVASTHVGSMGAIVAAKRGENHCGGIHLLDEATGEYNEAYLEKHFPKGGVRQVECVYRSQGLMVAPGNPFGITSLADLAQEGRSYVNRQKGSGTRILADYVCKRDGIDSSKIYGYDHEEFTHTAVAALVEAGSADAGMGIYSAAKMYGLGFVPVCEEQYDLLVPDYAWDTPQVAALIETLQSDAFRTRMEELGGYRVDQPGRVRRHYE
ncbi:MAG: molybdopterin biosynthesis protein [Eggerthellaceae bacterium]|nr:molybdopterin biosynthesis protein [Eggerthellaceae bacterium]